MDAAQEHDGELRMEAAYQPNAKVESSDGMALVQTFLSAAHARNTIRCYESDVKHFLSWGGTVPAPPELVAKYVAQHAGKHTPTTISRRLVAIGWAHSVGGYDSPTNSPLVKATIQGVRRKFGRPVKQAMPLLKGDVIRLVSGLRGVRGVRDKAMLLLGFSAALRRSELVAIECGDLEYVEEGLILHLRRSKTDQNGKGRLIAIPYARGRTCPCKAVRIWLEISRIQSGPLFRRIDKSNAVRSESLSPEFVGRLIKRRAEQAGLDPKRYSGHSLRAGFATSAAKAGASIASIRSQTGHQSDVMLQRYIRYAELFSSNANKKLGW